MSGRGAELTAALAHARQHYVTLLGLTVDDDDFQVDTWDETFPSTTGPFGGIGGQMFTTMSMQAIYCDAHGTGTLYCCGRPLRQVDRDRWRTIVSRRHSR